MTTRLTIPRNLFLTVSVLTVSVLTVFVLTVSGSPLFAQEGDPAERFESRITVREMLLDVVVTDRDGRAVPGLGAEDFIVREGGAGRELVSVAFKGHLRAPEPGEPTWSYDLGPGVAATPDPEPRYFVFFFHDLMRPDWQTFGVQTQQMVASIFARRWIEEELEPGDFVAILSFDWKLKIQQDFTRDRAALAAALDAMMMREDPEKTAVVRRTGPPSIAGVLPDGAALRDRSRNIREALGVLSEALRWIDGRKQLLLFTIGAGVSGPGAPPGEGLVEMINRANIDVYPIDLTPPDVLHLQSVTLRAMARDTDGKYYWNGGFEQALRDIDRRTNDYYQLAVARPEDAPDELGEVVVETRDPALRITVRRRFLD